MSCPSKDRHHHWDAFLALCVGAVGVAVGVLVTVWPDQSFTLLSVVLGAYLLAFGLFSLYWSRAIRPGSWTRRLSIGGSLAALAAATLLWARGAESMVLVMGLLWLMWGALQGAASLLGEVSDERGWWTVSGVASIAAGAGVLAWPAITPLSMAWVAGAWLIVVGTTHVGRGLEMQRTRADGGGP